MTRPDNTLPGMTILWPRGSLSDKQLRSLDSLLIKLGRRRFDHYRRLVGIESSTPNRRLSRGEAWKLLSIILEDQQ